MRPEGLEPPAYWFEASRSIQLSYGRAPTTILPRTKAAWTGILTRALPGAVQGRFRHVGIAFQTGAYREQTASK